MKQNIAVFIIVIKTSKCLPIALQQLKLHNNFRGAYIAACCVTIVATLKLWDFLINCTRNGVDRNINDACEKLHKLDIFALDKIIHPGYRSNKSVKR
jgi:hypothetical protein